MSASPIVLYQHHSHKGETKIFSPHTWKTRLDLDFFKVPYTTKELTYIQVRKDLAELTGNPAGNAPTIDVGEAADSKYITDSWAIAQYLEKTYGTADKSLFVSEEGKSFARFFEFFTTTIFANELRPLVVPKVIARLDEENREYFVKKIGGPERLATLQNITAQPDLLEAQLASARAKLGSVEDLLKEKIATGKGPYVSGTAYSHSDFVLFGWYAFTRIHPSIEAGVWRHASLPSVTAWLDGILASGLIDKEALAVVV